MEHKLHENLVLNARIRIKLPTKRNYEADGSSVSTCSERIEDCARCGLHREGGAMTLVENNRVNT